MQIQNYTKDELLDALEMADQQQDIQAVNEITGMLEEFDKSQGYQPEEFVSEESYRKVLEDAGKTVDDLPVFLEELRQKEEAGTLSNRERGIYGALSGRGRLGTGLDLVGTGISLSAREVSKFIPDSVEKKVVDGVTDAVKKLGEIPTVQKGLEAIGEGYQSYLQWKSENPNDAMGVESIVNVAEIFAPPFKRKPIPDKTMFRTMADKQLDKARELETGQRKDYLYTLITPISTKANDEARVKRMTQNDKGRNVYNPTDEEEEMVNILKRIPVSADNSLVGNRVILDTEVNKVHNSLVKQLGKSKVKLNKKELNTELESIVDDLQETNPVLVGDASAVAKKIFNKAQQLLAKSDGSPASLMQVRKDLDKWAKQQGKGSFDGNENAYTVAQRAVRDFLNKKVADAVPETAVLDKLRKQHLLLRASDRLVPKAAQEADTKIGRLVDNFYIATGTTPPKTMLGKVATVGLATSIVGGAGMLGALPYLASGAAAGTIGYAIYRGSVSPTLRKALSAALRETDNLLSSKLSKEMRKAIQADRVVLVEAMKLPTAPEGADDDE
ncbi:hypothetical protein N9Z29_00310 [bacterium]|nr:hypothetical protein [bacterium]